MTRVLSQYQGTRGRINNIEALETWNVLIYPAVICYPAIGKDLTRHNRYAASWRNSMKTLPQSRCSQAAKEGVISKCRHARAPLTMGMWLTQATLKARAMNCTRCSPHIPSHTCLNKGIHRVKSTGRENGNGRRGRDEATRFLLTVTYIYFPLF